MPFPGKEASKREAALAGVTGGGWVWNVDVWEKGRRDMGTAVVWITVFAPTGRHRLPHPQPRAEHPPGAQETNAGTASPRTPAASSGQSTLENWQSEFLQLFSFVVLSAVMIHRGSAESKDSHDRMERKLDEILRRSGEPVSERSGG